MKKIIIAGLVLGLTSFLLARPALATTYDFTTSCNGWNNCGFDSNGGFGSPNPMDKVFTDSSFTAAIYDTSNYLFYLSASGNAAPQAYCSLSWTGAGQFCASGSGMNCISYAHQAGDILSMSISAGTVTCTIGTNTVSDTGASFLIGHAYLYTSGGRIPYLDYDVTPTATPTPTPPPPSITPTPIIGGPTPTGIITSYAELNAVSSANLITYLHAFTITLFSFLSAIIGLMLFNIFIRLFNRRIE
jgi:hypothetical protein